MALPTPILMSAAGFSAPITIPMKYQNYQGLGVALLLNFSGGGPAVGTATVQVSNDPNVTANPAIARWNNHDILVGLSADKNSSIVYPCYAVRLNVTAYTSGSIQLQIGLQEYQL